MAEKETFPFVVRPIPPGEITDEAADAVADLLLDAVEKQEQAKEAGENEPENPV